MLILEQLNNQKILINNDTKMLQNCLNDIEIFCENSKKNVNLILSDLKEMIEFKENELNSQIEIIKKKKSAELEIKIESLNSNYSDIDCLNKLISFACSSNDFTYLDAIFFVFNKFEKLSSFEEPILQNFSQTNNFFLDYSALEHVKNVIKEINIESKFKNYYFFLNHVIKFHN